MTLTKTLAATAAALAALPAAALGAPVLSGVTADVFDVGDVPIGSVDQALDLVAGRSPDAAFAVTALDYPAGDDDTADSGTTSLSAFLGPDAASLTGTDLTLQDSVFVFTGQILLSEGEQTFAIGSDDGFRLTIGGSVIAEFNDSRGFGQTSVTVDAGVGLASFMLVFYDDNGDGGIEFLVDGSIAEAVGADVIPLPGAAVLLASGLVGAAAVRRRRT